MLATNDTSATTNETTLFAVPNRIRSTIVAARPAANRTTTANQ
jgi:hypothetical protein